MDRINEGVLDAVTNAAKMTAQAAVTAMGSNKAAGALRATKIATTMYSGFKRSMGSTGGEATANLFNRFLKLETVLEPPFIEHWSREFQKYLSMSSESRKNYIASYNHDKDSSLHLQRVEDEYDADYTNDDEEEGLAVIPPNSAVRLTASTDMESEMFTKATQPSGEVINHLQNTSKWQKLSSGDEDYVWNTRYDGSIIVLDRVEKAKVLQTLMSKGHSPQDLAMAIYDAGLFSTANLFFNKHKGKYVGKNFFFRDALMTSVVHLGFNKVSQLNRFVMMVPGFIANYKEVPSQKKQKLQIVESENPKDQKNKISDKELRDFFLLMAHSAYFSGYIREQAEASKNSIMEGVSEIIDRMVEDTVAADIAVVPTELFKAGKPAKKEK